MRSLITPILMLIFCLPCHAATSLRSGEHPEFSRIVIDLPRIGNWSLQPSGNVYIFSAETLSPPVNTDDVFRFIPRTRIKSIEYHEQKNEIVFELECLTCAVSAFEIPEGRIVVDFKDKESKNETEVSSDKAEKERHESENKIVLEDKDLSSHSRPYSDLVSMPIFSKRQYLPHFGKVLKSDIEKEVEETNIQEWDISEELDQRLTYSSTHVEKEGMIEQIEINESESHTSQLSSMIKTTELSRVEEDNNQRHPEKGRSCVELNSLALLPIDPEYGDIADAYKKVIDARDTPKVEGLIELARVQISLGFEHEALKSIELLPIDNQYASALSAISNLLATNALSLEESEYLKKCDGDHTVWSFVVSETGLEITQSLADQLILEFLNLPYELRRRLAAPLIERLTVMGYEENAYRILENIRNSQHGKFEDSIVQSVTATAARHFDNQEAFQGVELEVNINSGKIDSLVVKIEKAIENQLDLGDADWELIDSLMYQFRANRRGKVLIGLSLIHSLTTRDLKRASDILQLHLRQNKVLTDIELQRFIEIAENEESGFILLFLSSYLANWGGQVLMLSQGGDAMIPIREWLDLNLDRMAPRVDLKQRIDSRTDKESGIGAEEGEKSKTQIIESILEAKLAR